MTPRILAISWEMPPLSGPRAIQVSRVLAALARRGWPSRVIAVAPQPEGPLLRDTAGAPPFLAQGVDVVRVPSPQERGWYRTLMRAVPGLAHRPDRARGWLPPAVQEAERWLRRETPECVVTFAQPWTDHLIGLRLYRDHGLPWVAHFSDPWVDSPYLATATGAQAFAARAEADVIRDATAVVFVTAETADVVMAKYPAEWRRKVHVVPHGYDRESFAHVRRSRAAGARLQLVYTGRFYSGLRTPATLFAALSRMAATRALHDELEVLLIGPGMQEFEPLVRSHHLERVVRLHDAIPYEQALQAAADADALLVLDADTQGASMFLPSKVVDYLLWRRPIVGLTPRHGATAALLQRLQMPVAPPGDVAAIAAVLNELLDAWHGHRLNVPPGFDQVAAEYDIERSAASFAQVLDRCH